MPSAADPRDHGRDFLEAGATDGQVVLADATTHHWGTRAALVGAVSTGLITAIQGRANGALAQAAGGDALLAALVSIAIGLGFLVAVLAVRRPARTALLVRLPQLVRAREVQWWWLIGGLFSALFVATQGVSSPALGVAVFTVLVVAGTTGSSLVFDAVGVTPGGRRPVTGPRVVGAVGTTLAIVVAVSGQLSAGSLAIAGVVLTVTAGVAGTFQMAINGLVAEATDEGLVPVALNLGLATVVLALVVPLVHLVQGTAYTLPPALWSQPWIYLGGPLGVGFLLLSAIVVRPLGVLVYSLLSIGGQLVSALVLDLVVPTSAAAVGWQVVLGVLLTGAAVTVAALPTRRSQGAA